MTDNIFLYIPNIIDYCRVILAFMSFYYMPTDHYKAACLYLLCGFLDEIDGRLARLLKQTSKLGAMLDQLTDRIITMCMCAALGHFYPAYILFFQFSMALDIFSHGVYIHSSLMIGKASHKHVDSSANLVLRHYYTNEYLMTVLCLGSEVFYCLLYLRHFTIGPVVAVVNISIGLWTLLLVVAAPIAVVKMIVNGVQLVIACRNIAAIDITEREKEALEERNKYKGE